MQLSFVVTPDDIRAFRKTVSMTQIELANALQIEVAEVRDWEKGERFPTKALCDKMEALKANPPPPGQFKKKQADPFAVMADPAFHALMRKIVAHTALRLECAKLASRYDDPAAPADDE